MPVLIRIIIQRILLFSLGFLAFLGINPDIHIPTIEEIKAVEEKQEETIEKILTPETKTEDVASIQEIKEEVTKISEQIEKKESEAQKTLESFVNIPQIKSTQTGIVASENFYENVVVNIVCVDKGENFVKMTTGSGVIVSPSGIVLTNTHVANNFLFDDKKENSYKECIIKRENIPNYGFNAELVYLSDDWLLENQEFFINDNPRGNGENDYALLAITSNTNPVLELPLNFSYVNIITDDRNINEGDKIFAAAYPGIGTGVFSIDNQGKLKKAETFIDELLTFYSNSVDVISTGPNEVAKRGSSGGGIFKDEKLLGIVVTTDNKGEGDYINAITLPYIASDFFFDTGTNFRTYISKDKKTLISEYKNDIINLKKLINKFL